LRVLGRHGRRQDAIVGRFQYFAAQSPRNPIAALSQIFSVSEKSRAWKTDGHAAIANNV
jgi:hypothetical protein